MLQKYLTIFVRVRSLLPFIDEFAHQGLISQISIMLLLKNTSIKAYWYESNKMLLLYPRASLDHILTENVTQSIRNMTYHGALLFFEHVLLPFCYYYYYYYYYFIIIFVCVICVCVCFNNGSLNNWLMYIIVMFLLLLTVFSCCCKNS